MKANQTSIRNAQATALQGIGQARLSRSQHPKRLTRRQMKAARRITLFRTHERLLALHRADIEQMNEERRSDNWKLLNGGASREERRAILDRLGPNFGFPKFSLAKTVEAISRYRNRPDAYLLERISPSDEAAASEHILRKDVEAIMANRRHSRRVQREAAEVQARARSRSENYGGLDGTRRLAL